MFPTHFGSILDEATTPPSGANQARHCAQESRFGIARQKNRRRLLGSADDPFNGEFWKRMPSGRYCVRSALITGQIALLAQQAEDGATIGEICRKASISGATWWCNFTSGNSLTLEA
jgi:hypothetical protein